MKRYGMAIKIKPENLDEYKRLHVDVWPDVLKMIGECNIRNYSIYHKDGMMFSCFEYVGKDFDADMAKWLPMRRLKNGGMCASRSWIRSKPAPRENSGRTWKRSSTVHEIAGCRGQPA